MRVSILDRVRFVTVIKQNIADSSISGYRRVTKFESQRKLLTGKNGGVRFFQRETISCERNGAAKIRGRLGKKKTREEEEEEVGWRKRENGTGLHARRLIDPPILIYGVEKGLRRFQPLVNSSRIISVQRFYACPRDAMSRELSNRVEDRKWTGRRLTRARRERKLNRTCTLNDIQLESIYRILR